MAYRSGIYTYEWDSHQLHVDAPASGVQKLIISVGDLWDFMKLAQASEEGVQYPILAEAEGLSLFDPSSGLYSALTVRMNPYSQVLFEERPMAPYFVRVKEGNLIGGLDDEPLGLTGGVTVRFDVSISASAFFIPFGSGLSQAEHDALLSIQDIEEGDWELDSLTNQMILTRKDHVTVLARFDLKNKAGVPSTDAVYSRRSTG